MYTPQKFSINDKETIRRFIEKNSFGILISKHGGEFYDTHTPLFLSSEFEYVYGHIARANSQWKGWNESSSVKVIFHGPHAYISPNYYVGSFNVPTWNYTAVSISGKIEILESVEEQKQLIHSLVVQNEKIFTRPWRLDEEDEKLMDLFNAIVCFRVKVENIEAKFKLNQNKTEENRLSVIEHLRKSGLHMSSEVAILMEQAINEPDNRGNA